MYKAVTITTGLPCTVSDKPKWNQRALCHQSLIEVERFHTLRKNTNVSIFSYLLEVWDFLCQFLQQILRFFWCIPGTQASKICNHQQWQFTGEYVNSSVEHTACNHYVCSLP